MQISLEQCKNLRSALTFHTDHGSCIVRSTALMLDMPGATLVFGVVRASSADEIARDSNASPEPFIHAWVEHKGMVFAPTLLERVGSLRGFPAKVYYEANGVTTTWKLEPNVFNAIAKRFKLAAAFKHGSDRAGKREVTETLLRTAKVKYRLSERKTLLPV